MVGAASRPRQFSLLWLFFRGRVSLVLSPVAVPIVGLFHYHSPSLGGSRRTLVRGLIMATYFANLLSPQLSYHNLGVRGNHHQRVVRDRESEAERKVPRLLLCCTHCLQQFPVGRGGCSKVTPL